VVFGGGNVDAHGPVPGQHQVAGRAGGQLARAEIFGRLAGVDRNAGRVPPDGAGG